MIRNVWSVLCKDILTDQETNSVTFIQCIEEGAVATLPTQTFPICIGTLWENDTEEKVPFAARVVFVRPSGTVLPLLQTKEVVFSRPRQRLVFKLAGLPVTEFGRHEVRVEIKQDDEWQTASRLPFMVRKLVPPAR